MTTEHELLIDAAAGAAAAGGRRGLISDPQVRYKGTIGGDISHGDPATTIRP